MRKKRLIYIAKSHIPSRWANSIQVVNMVNASANYFGKVDLIVPYKFKRWVYNLLFSAFKPYGIKKRKNIGITYLKRKEKKETGFEERAIEYIKKKYGLKEEILFFTRSIFVAYTLSKCGYNLIYESHQFEKDKSNNFFDDFINIVKRFENIKIISISNYIRNKYIEEGIDKNKVKCFYDGVNPELFLGSRNVDLRKFFPDINIDRKRIMYVGSLQKEKGVEFLCEVAYFLKKYDIVIFGGNIDEVKRLKQKYRFPNLYIHPFIKNYLVPAVLKHADIIVLPYLKEGNFVRGMSPLKLYESLMSKRIVLVSDLAVLKEVLKDKVNCIMFNPEDKDDFLSKIDFIEGLTEKEKDKIIHNGFELALDNSWDQRAKRIFEWFYDV